MKKIINKIVLLLIVFLMVFLLSSCKGKSDSFVIGTTMAIEKAERGEYNYEVLSSGLSNLPLIYQDENGEYHPLVASYETKDFKTYTYTIIDGLKWSDGTLVTAEDIYFSLVREDEKDGKTNFSTENPKYEKYEISEDKRSISLTLSVPSIRELSNMTTFRILPKHIYEKEVITQEEKNVCLGPYILKEFNKESGSLIFVPNSLYPKTGFQKSVIVQIFGNEDTMYGALNNGDIMMTWNYSKGIEPRFLDVLSDDLKIIKKTADNIPVALSFNCSKSPFDDLRLRKAISYVLDYEMLAKKLGSSFAEVSNKGFVPSSCLGFAETEKNAKDLEKAKELLKSAGFEPINGRYELSLDLTYNLSKETQIMAAELVKNQLESFGIAVNLDGCDSASYNAKTSNKFSSNNITMQAALYSYTSAGVAMENGMASIYADGNHSVQGGCQVFDKEFQDILDKMKNAKDLSEYKIAGEKLQKYYEENVPFIALYWDDFVYAVNKDYDGFYIDNVFGLNNERTWTNLK